VWKRKQRKRHFFLTPFHDPSSKDCKQTNSAQTCAFLNLDKKYGKQIRPRGGPSAGCTIQIKCSFLQTIKSECKYNVLFTQNKQIKSELNLQITH